MDMTKLAGTPVISIGHIPMAGVTGAQGTTGITGRIIVTAEPALLPAMEAAIERIKAIYMLAYVGAAISSDDGRSPTCNINGDYRCHVHAINGYTTPFDNINVHTIWNDFQEILARKSSVTWIRIVSIVEST